MHTLGFVLLNYFLRINVQEEVSDKLHSSCYVLVSGQILMLLKNFTSRAIHQAVSDSTEYKVKDKFRLKPLAYKEERRAPARKCFHHLRFSASIVGAQQI